jgi:imidazolonepropionase-like amidohydrolase
MIRWSGLAVVFAVAASSARADCVALVGGRIVLPGGKPTPGTVVIRDGRIVDAAASVTVPDGCRRIAIDGKVVTPGFIDPSTTLGVDEIDLESSTQDGDAGGTDPVRAAFRVADGYNPRSVLIPVARLGGVTSCVVSPGGGTVSGQAAWVDLVSSSQDDAVSKAPIALSVSLAGTAGGSLRMLRELIEDARRFVTQREAWERGQSRVFPWSRLDLEALRPVIDGKIPLVIGADRASDIEAVLRFAAEEKVRIVIRGAAEGHLVAASLARAGVGVIVDPLVYGPGGYDQVRGRRDNAALLARASVTVAISASSPHNLRKLRQLAGNAVREGLPWEAGLDAITAAPAKLFGREGYGVLAAGAVANVAVWSDDPLEISTRLEQLFVRGQAVELRSRQTELFERYRKTPGTPRPALALP